MENVYLGCQSIKGCVGYPAGCIAEENCDMLMTYTKASSGYQFEIAGTTGSSGYVAGALSSDDHMGDDSVMACTLLDGKVDILMAFNVGKGNEVLSDSKYGIKEIQSTQADGKVYCSFIREAVTEIKNVEFDLAANSYNLMLAKGPYTENKLSYHSSRMSTSDSLSLDSFELPEINSSEDGRDLFVSLHAAFMIGAWIAAASSGIILARYFKKTWLQNRCFGIDQWFLFHRIFMILTWSLTMVGFGLIAYYLGSWSEVPLDINPHPILGIFSVVLCFIQPFMAAFRCSPTHKNRPIFNWLHWGVGNSAQILGLIAIFYGLKLVNAPIWSWIIMIVFVVFHVAVHIILSIGECVYDSKANRTNNVTPMKEMNGSQDPLHPDDMRIDALGGTFRKTMLGVYLAVTWLLAAALIIVVVLGEQNLLDAGVLFWEN